MRSLTSRPPTQIIRCGLAHLFLIGILAGCGTPAGESLGGAPVSGSPQSNTPPTVVSTSPASAAVNVSPATTVNASFSEAVNSASLSNTTFSLRDPTGVVGGAVSSAGTTATFTPIRNLSLATPYTATVLATVTNAADIPMGADYSWGFITRDGVWGSAQAIGPTAGDAFEPQVAVDPNGNALAVWFQFDGTRDNLWANRFTPATGWGAAQLIESDNAGGASSPLVAVDPSGNALAVWIQFDGTRENLWANRFAPATDWGTAQLIESDNAGGAFGPQVAVDPSGNALAVWYQLDGTRSDIWANRFVPTAGWGTAQLIETDNAGSASLPQVAVDPTGNALAVWLQSDGIRSNIWANRLTPSTGWGTAQLIESDNTGSASWPYVAMEPSGNALAVWLQSDGIRDNLWANRFVPAAGWGTAQLLETDNAGSASRPYVAMDPSGNALTVWIQSDGIRDNLWANRFVPTAGWGTAQLLESDNAGGALAPHMAMDPNGNALAVWSQSDGTRQNSYNIWVNRFTSATGWGTAQLLEIDNTREAVSPRVAVDSSGNALAVWYQFDGTRYRVFANRFE